LRAGGHETLFASLRAPALTTSDNFPARADALGDLDFILASPERLPEALRAEAEALRATLEAADAALFASLRARLRAGLRGADLLAVLDALAPPTVRLRADAAGYDALDLLLDGVLLDGEPPAPSSPLTPDMVGLQQTPARVILELAAQLSLRLPESRVACSRFYDIGSGLGRVALMATLLTGCAAHGLDFEAGFVDYARARAADLGVERVTFTTGDARLFDLGPDAPGWGRVDRGDRAEDIYFLYTPFRGALLADVLDRLRLCAPRARLFTYGPCSAEVAAHPGYRRVPSGDFSPDRLEEFFVR